MNLKYKIILPLGLLLFIAAACNKPVPSTSTKPISNPTPTAASGTGTKLSDEPYAKMAYLINPDNLSSDAKLALTGFKLDKQTLVSGDTQITLTALKPGYTTQVLDLAPGDQLYFIEKTLRDDSVSDNDDGTYGDDMAVVVDKNGYVVQTAASTANTTK